MSTLTEVLINGVWAVLLAVSCYVLGNRRAMRIIEYRDRQAARLDGSDPFGDKPIAYRRCLCGHATTSHRLNARGERVECNAHIPGKGSCACQGYMGDPDTKMKG